MMRKNLTALMKRRDILLARMLRTISGRTETMSQGKGNR